MENLNNRDLRAIMFYNYKRGINAMECITEMFSVFGEQCPTKNMRLQVVQPILFGLHVLGR